MGVWKDIRNAAGDLCAWAWAWAVNAWEQALVWTWAPAEKAVDPGSVASGEGPLVPTGSSSIIERDSKTPPGSPNAEVSIKTTDSSSSNGKATPADAGDEVIEVKVSVWWTTACDAFAVLKRGAVGTSTTWVPDTHTARETKLGNDKEEATPKNEGDMVGIFDLIWTMACGACAGIYLWVMRLLGLEDNDFSVNRLWGMGLMLAILVFYAGCKRVLEWRGMNDVLPELWKRPYAGVVTGLYAFLGVWVFQPLLVPIFLALGYGMFLAWFAYKCYSKETRNGWRQFASWGY